MGCLDNGRVRVIGVMKFGGEVWVYLFILMTHKIDLENRFGNLDTSR